MLQRRITLSDIDKCFYRPTNQNLEVRKELSHTLSQHGLSWPPMPESLSSCAAYSLSSRASALGEHIARSGVDKPGVAVAKEGVYASKWH